MLSFNVTEDSVYGLLPNYVLRPDKVTTTSKGGVDRTQYNATELRYNAYIMAELSKAGIPTSVYINTDSVPVLLSAAQSHLIAASIVRMYDNPQNPYKDLFASGNMFLRQYIDNYYVENYSLIMNAPEFAISEDIDLTDYSFQNILIS